MSNGDPGGEGRDEREGFEGEEVEEGSSVESTEADEGQLDSRQPVGLQDTPPDFLAVSLTLSPSSRVAPSVEGDPVDSSLWEEGVRLEGLKQG